jgi:hypothetical protein
MSSPADIVIIFPAINHQVREVAHHDLLPEIVFSQSLLIKLPPVLHTFPVTVAVKKCLGAPDFAIGLPFEILLHIRILGILNIRSHRLPYTIHPAAINMPGVRCVAAIA